MRNIEELDIDHIQHILEKRDETVRAFNRFMRGIGISKRTPFTNEEVELAIGDRVFLTEFEQAVSVETDTESSENTEKPKDKTTEYQSIMDHNKVNRFEKDIVETLSEDVEL